MLHGPHPPSATLQLIAGAFTAIFGICMLVADVVAISYIFSKDRASSRFYWTTFVVVVAVNLLILSVGDGLWWQAMTGPPQGERPDPPIFAVNVISIPAMLLFFAAPWVRNWRLGRIGR